MEETNSLKRAPRLNKRALANVVAFFTLEVLAFVAFSLGTSYVLYTVLSFVLLIFLSIVTYKQINTDGLATYAFFLFPVFVYGLLSAMCAFANLTKGFSLNHLSFLIPLGMTCMAACGFLAANVKAFKIEQALLVIYSALALLTFINLLATMVEFCPFYTFIYRNKYMFYDGKISEVPVSQMAFSLLGFSLSEVSTSYFSFFPSLLITAVIPLFFLNLKENKKHFLLYLSYFLLGCLALLMTFSIYSFISDFLIFTVILFVMLFAKFPQERKIFIKILITVLCLFLLVLVIIFINAQENGNMWKGVGGFFESFQDLIKKNRMLNRLFNTNRFVSKYNQIINDIFTSSSETNKFFGCVPNTLETPYLPSDSWIFDNLMTSGFFGAIFFLFFLIVGIRRVFVYFGKGKDDLMVKTMIMGFIFSLFAYSVYAYDVTPYVFKDYYSPLYLSGPFLIGLFLMSYAFAKSFLFNKKVKAKILDTATAGDETNADAKSVLQQEKKETANEKDCL